MKNSWEPSEKTEREKVYDDTNIGGNIRQPAYWVGLPWSSAWHWLHRYEGFGSCREKSRSGYEDTYSSHSQHSVCRGYRILRYLLSGEIIIKTKGERTLQMSAPFTLPEMPDYEI